MAVLDKGVIQQVGSPLELYDRPENLFVANFLGTANILEGKVEIDGATRRFVTSTGDQLSLPDDSTGNGANIVLRPQNISISRTQASNSLPGTVQHSEFLGSQIRYLVAAGGTEIVVDQSHRAGQDRIETGANVHLVANTQSAVVL